MQLMSRLLSRLGILTSINSLLITSYCQPPNEEDNTVARSVSRTARRLILEVHGNWARDIPQSTGRSNIACQTGYGAQSPSRHVTPGSCARDSAQSCAMPPIRSTTAQQPEAVAHSPSRPVASLLHIARRFVQECLAAVHRSPTNVGDAQAPFLDSEVINEARAQTLVAISTPTRQVVNNIQRHRRAQLDTPEHQALNERRRQRRAAMHTPERNIELEARRAAWAAVTTPVRQEAIEAQRVRRASQPTPQQDVINANRGRRRLSSAAQANSTGFLKSSHDASVQLHDLGQMTLQCNKCGAKFWRGEICSPSSNAYSPCCRSGRVVLPNLLDPPEPLLSLLRNAHFRKHIREYNTRLQMTSTGAHIESFPSGPQQFRISGKVYHRMGPIFPDGRPKCLQLFILDSDAHVNEVASSNIRLQVLRDLREMLVQNNPYVRIFREASTLDDVSIPSLRVVLRASSLAEEQLEGRRRGNLPSAPEIAAFIPESNDSSREYRDIVVHFRAPDGGLGVHRITEKSPAYDPLQFPLLFPYGEAGWTVGLRCVNVEGHRQLKRDKLTIRDHAAYRLQERTNQSQILLQSGRLSEEFIVDQYGKMEGDRLDFIFHNQRELRSEMYNGVHDQVLQGDLNAAATGTRIILPASFTGGPRYMTRLYHDAMAVVRKYGKPDLFITFTCNPKWKEITDMLKPGQTPSDRPDIISRVFRLKLKELLTDLIDKGGLGKVVAHMHTIEFQKRGLPHAHILLILDSSSKFRSTSDYDDIVCAELPDPSDAELYNVVTTCMMHGPCGQAFMAMPCMNPSTGKCEKRYPRDFQEETLESSDGYPIYRRRNDGRYFERNGVRLDNRWVIPYNPALCRKYKAHINVEICASIKSVKYLHKYIFKGHDIAHVNFARSDGVVNENEIERYLSGRYVSTSEAIWRIFMFDLHKQSPAVYHMVVHLPGEQRVIFEANANLQVVDQLGPPRTMLTAWFELNQQNIANARSLLYCELPEKFVWDRANKRWKARQRTGGLDNHVIGRMYFVHPSAGERFFLRLLLNHVRGPTSFEDVRRVDGVLCTNYREAAIRMGILQDDGEWRAAIQDAVSAAMPSQLREFFATLLLYCDVSVPSALWEEFKHQMSEDFSLNRHHAIGNNGARDVTVEDEDRALLDIMNILQGHGKSLQDFGLREPNVDIILGRDSEPFIIQEQKSFDRVQLREIVENGVLKLNSDQRDAYDKVMAAVRRESDSNMFFLDSPGGCGKTFLLNLMLSSIRADGKIALACATSGIAALLLAKGTTAHSRFKIPVKDIDEASMCAISPRSNLGRLIYECELIVWDEAPMAHKHCFEAVDRSLRDIMNINKPFGGKCVVMAGDFRQILPVVIRGSREAIVSACLRRSYLWDDVVKLRLTINMRIATLQGLNAEQQAAFADFLLKVGEGRLGTPKLHLPREFVSTSSNHVDLIQEIFGDMQGEPIPIGRSMVKSGIVSPTNDDVDALNVAALEKFPGNDACTFLSADYLLPEQNAAEFSTEFLNTLQPQGMHQHCLTLKVGAPIMLLRNLNAALGLANGTRLIVTHMSPRVLQAETVSEVGPGRPVFIPRISLTSNDPLLPVQFTRRQFPVRLAFAMTINKSQGQTFTKIGVHLSKPCFSHGQLYVALSRVGKPEALKVMLPSDLREDCVTDNVVFDEALS